MIIVDVGASNFHRNKGYNIHRFNKAYLFEPLPEFYQELYQAYKEEDSVELFNMALSNYTGTATFYQTQKRNCSSLYKPNPDVLSKRPDITTYKEIEVKVDTLDNVVGHLPRVDFLKLDTQGTEYEILLCAEKVLKVTERIMVEVEYEEMYQGQKLKNEVKELIISKGFKQVQEKKFRNHSDLYFQKVR